MNAQPTALADLKSRRKVLLTATRDNDVLALARTLAERHPPRQFDLTAVHEQAEIVLYLEAGYIGLSELPALLRRLRAAPQALHFLFSETDWPFAVLPGAYPSLSQRCAWAQSWSYFPRPGEPSDPPMPASEPAFLFSFLGRASTHPVRQAILQLDSDSSPCVDLPVAHERLSRFDYAKSYRGLIADSKFVLCPRGFGVSSMRTFEVMSAGRVPVVISDRWQRVPQIPWDDFCVFVSEREVGRIPALLGSLEHGWEERGRRARAIFEQFFAPEVFFDRLLDMMVTNFSACGQATGDNLLRAWQSLGWREAKTLVSQAKHFVSKKLA